MGEMLSCNCANYFEQHEITNTPRAKKAPHTVETDHGIDMDRAKAGANVDNSQAHDTPKKVYIWKIKL